MPAAQTSIYSEVVKVTNVYLGPAAERFIGRQAQNHLHKLPEDLTVDDLEKLIDWIRVGVSFLTDDSEMVEEYTQELHKIMAARRQKS